MLQELLKRHDVRSIVNDMNGIDLSPLDMATSRVFPNVIRVLLSECPDLDPAAVLNALRDAEQLGRSSIAALLRGSRVFRRAQRLSRATAEPHQ